MEEGRVVQRGAERGKQDSPDAKNPVVGRVRVSEAGALGGGEVVTDVTVRLWWSRGQMVSGQECGSGRECEARGGQYVEKVWAPVVLGVVVHGPCVQNHDGVFGDEVAIVREVFGRDVPRSEPKGVVAALYLCGSCQLR